MHSTPLVVPRRRSLAIWSVLALAMVALSFALTIFLALAGIYLPWVWLSSTANLGSIALFIFGVLMSATMLWSIVPRIDRFNKIRDPQGSLLKRERRSQRVRDFVSQALALAVISSGWKLNATPGQLSLCRGDARLDPKAVIDGMVSNAQERSAWLEKARAFGIEDVPLVSKSAAASA